MCCLWERTDFGENRAHRLNLATDSADLGPAVARCWTSPHGGRTRLNSDKPHGVCGGHGGGGGQEPDGRETRGRPDSESAIRGKSAQRRRQGRAGGHAGPPRGPGRETHLPALPGGGSWAAGQQRGEQRREPGAWRGGHGQPGLLTVAPDPRRMSARGELPESQVDRFKLFTLKDEERRKIALCCTGR